jgi:hypothetical protein
MPAELIAQLKQGDHQLGKIKAPGLTIVGAAW